MTIVPRPPFTPPACPGGAVAIGCLLVALLPAGCGSGLPETVPVSGCVTYQGQPLTSGQIVFHPRDIMEGLPQRPATGVLDGEGCYQLTTFRPGDGAVPGSYHVTVFSYLTDQTSASDDVSIPTTVWRIPPRYGNPQTSDLTADIPIGSSPLNFDFDLTDTPP